MTRTLSAAFALALAATLAGCDRPEPNNAGSGTTSSGSSASGTSSSGAAGSGSTSSESTDKQKRK